MGRPCNVYATVSPRAPAVFRVGDPDEISSTAMHGPPADDENVRVASPPSASVAGGGGGQRGARRAPELARGAHHRGEEGIGLRRRLVVEPRLTPPRSRARMQPPRGRTR